MKKQESAARINFKVPPKKRREFLLACRMRGRTMTEVLAEMMDRVIEEERGKDERRFNELLAALHEETNHDGEPELSLKVDKAKPHNHK